MKLIFRGLNEYGGLEYSKDLGLGIFFKAYDDGLLDKIEQRIDRKWIRVQG
jgi:hypothetical protein